MKELDTAIPNYNVQRVKRFHRMKMYFKIALTAAVLAVSATAGTASTIFAQSVTTAGGVTCSISAKNSDRTDICNSLGTQDVNGSFSEGGFLSTANYQSLTYTFGGFFTGPMTIWEVTGGSVNNLSYIEQLSFFLVNSVTDLVSAGTIVNIDGVGDGVDRWRIETDFAGIYDSLVVADSSTLYGNRDGFDIDAISVMAVPLPASALLLLASLGGLGALRRKKKS